MIQAAEVTKCTETGCSALKVASVNNRARCLSHFLSYCYRQIDQCELKVSRKEHWNTAVSGQAYETLSDIADVAAAVGLGCYDLEGIERAQIVQILGHIEKLIGNFRRFPRMKIQIPLSIRVKTSGRVELVTTLDISHRGASFTHKCLFNRGDLLLVRNLNSEDEGEARIMWTRTNRGKRTSGIELLGSGCLWELELSE